MQEISTVKSLNAMDEDDYFSNHASLRCASGADALIVAMVHPTLNDSLFLVPVHPAKGTAVHGWGARG
jgi:hypothetical protein